MKPKKIPEENLHNLEQEYIKGTYGEEVVEMLKLEKEGKLTPEMKAKYLKSLEE